MEQAPAQTAVTEVRDENGRQIVVLPAGFHLSGDRVFLRRDPETGIIQISEQPYRPSLQEVFQMFDRLDLSDFEMERDRTLPREVEL